MRARYSHSDQTDAPIRDGSEAGMAAGKRRRLFLFLPPLLGAVIVLVATGVWGVGLTGDSVSYYNAGANLLVGRGLITDVSAAPALPLTHWPPLYPAVLAPLQLAQTGIERSARFLNAGLFALYIAGVQALVLRATARSMPAATLTGLYAALSTVMLSLYARLWSETLFLVLFVFALWLLCRYLDAANADVRWSGWPSLPGAAALCALAWLARYVGVTLVLGGGLAILAFSRTSSVRRLRDAALFVLIASTPMALFLLRNELVAGNLTNRALGLHPPGGLWWRHGLDTLSAWTIPIAAPVWMKAAAAVAVGLLAAATLYFILLDRRQMLAPGDEGVRAWVTPAALLLFSAVYLVFFYAVVTLADSGDLSGRILSPVYTAMLVAAAYTGHALLRRYGAGRPLLAMGALTLIVGALLAVQAARTAMWTAGARADGLDYSGRAWRTAPALDALQALPNDAPIYSNWPQVIFYLTGRKAHPLAFRPCAENCLSVGEDLAAIPEAKRGEALVIWAKGEGRYECYDCLLWAAEAQGYAPIFEDERFQFFEWSGP